MERLTERDSYGDVYVKQHDYIAASIRLAAYEDTGLTPEEIMEMKEFYSNPLNTAVPALQMPEPYRPQSADAALDPPVQAECNFEDDER